MRTGLAGMVTEPLAGVTVTGKVAAPAVVAEVDLAPVVDLDDDPQAAGASISIKAAARGARRSAVRVRGRPAAPAVVPSVDRMVTRCSFTVSSCRSRAAARRQWRCRSTCAFLACV